MSINGAVCSRLGDQVLIVRLSVVAPVFSVTGQHCARRPFDFWDVKGVLLVDFLPSGETVDANRYCQTLDQLREAIRRKRPGRLSKGVILQHDNATPHNAKRTQDWLKRYNWETLPHPPHSPDLAPSDFLLFRPLKRHLAGQHFQDDDDLIEEVTSWLHSLDKKFLRDGIYSLMQRWKKCLDLHGDYVEK